MNNKIKEQLELVIIQCSALKAKLDEATARNRQYEAEIEHLRKALAQQQSLDSAKNVEETFTSDCEQSKALQCDVQVEKNNSLDGETLLIEEQPSALFGEMSHPTEETAVTDTEELIPDTASGESVDAKEAAGKTLDSIAGTISETIENSGKMSDDSTASSNLSDASPLSVESFDERSFQSVLEIGADLVTRALTASKEHIQRLEKSHPDDYTRFTDIIRSRIELFKIEISSIIGSSGSNNEKRERMNEALIKLNQYFENIK